ncbi:MAG TPA: hypothetical protein VI386_07020 [Candidatus Sulfotelmatobacter sp.]
MRGQPPPLSVEPGSTILFVKDRKPETDKLIHCLIFVLLGGILSVAESFMPKIVHHPAFSIVGIEARTSNVKEKTSEAVIGKQWQKFFHDNVLQKIPTRSTATFTPYTATTPATATENILSR